MTLTRYVFIRSWHAWTLTTRGDMRKTRCGRFAAPGSAISDDPPLNEPSCESCLRLVADDLRRALEPSVPVASPQV